MEVAENKHRLWRLDREVFDYSTLPLVLDAVFRQSYEEELLRQSVIGWASEVDYRRFLGHRIDRRDEPFGFCPVFEPFNVEVSVVEDFGPRPNIYVALSKCPASYVTSWSKVPGVEPADLFGPADNIWSRLFPDGELDRSRCLTWSLLSGGHRSHPVALAEADPMSAEMMVPSGADRAKRLRARVALDRPADPLEARIEAVTGQTLTYEALIGLAQR